MKIRAKMFATMAHKNQVRKLSHEAYVSHPIRVAKRLQDHRFSEEVICAGYLHDVVEDTDFTLADIEKQFGRRVAELVALHTEDKGKSWRERKEQTIATVKDSCKEAKYVIVADKLDNLLDIQKALADFGEETWDAFQAGKDEQQWYYEAIAENMYHGLDEADVPDFFPLYEDVVKAVFQEI